MQGLAYSLLASAEINARGQFSIPTQLPQSDISVPESGLYALIIDHKSRVIWRSPSSLGENIPDLRPVTAGAIHFERHRHQIQQPFIFRLGSVWGSGEGKDRFLTFAIVQSKDSYVRQIKDYRETLVRWLGGGALFILFIQGFLLLRELRPLKRVVSEIDAIEQGKSDHIKGQYPTELAILTQSMNRLIHNEREQLARYRHGLDDLAHSLKTPLAVIQSLGKEKHLSSQQANQLHEHVKRMTEIIDYQLKRAASAGKKSLGAHTTLLAPVIQKTLATLNKVYIDKNIQAKYHCEADIVFPGDRDDLYEIIGNISDNAYKWAKSKVRINCQIITEINPPYLEITIEDDGQGFSLESQQQITQRGVRADEQMPGQGIGMAVVQSIVRNYGAELTTDNSKFGGAQVILKFPL